MAIKPPYIPIAPQILNGLSVRPESISGLGTVAFTAANGDIINPNEVQCLAYGYKFDKSTGTCRAFTSSQSLQPSLVNESNTVNGQGNVAGVGTNNTFVMGSDNTVSGNSRNNIVVGSNNTISEDIDNANVFGTLGEVTATNSIVLGGNASTDTLGERQSIHLMYGHQTTNNSTVDAFLNNTTDSYFVVPENTAIYFQSESLALRVGGSSGSGAVGDFKSWVERGVVVNKSGTLSIQRSRTSPASSGTTTGWSAINSVSGTNFLQTVKGATDMTIEWVSNIRITQIKAGVTL